MGNRTKYNKSIVAKICGFIESGLNNKQACAAAGISETSLRVWRNDHPDFAEKVEQAREIMRAKVLAEIKRAGAKDWRAHEAFLRLAFAEYRFGNGTQVNVALQNNMSLSERDPQRARLIEMRAAALAKRDASEPAQLADRDARERYEEALEAERKIKEGQSTEAHDAEPPRLQERPPQNIIERCDEQARRMRAEGWKSANDSDELLDGC
jgi:terminase small subunit-like protein